MRSDAKRQPICSLRDPDARSDPESRECDLLARHDAVGSRLRGGVQHARRKARRRCPSAAAELHNVFVMAESGRAVVR
jgi:hypothetical protein